MNYRTKNRLGMVVVAFQATTVVFAASTSGAVGTVTSARGIPHAQQR
ncbi:hypothetical protein LGM43_28300 [Burkholderia seminalis]|nr:MULTISPECIES: hypothetical protein [Burkholderia cepacia complex]MCA7954177.1 hypothetical protein [Burkholderia seminalis]